VTPANGTPKVTWVMRYSKKRDGMFTEPNPIDITPEMAAEALEGDKSVRHNRDFRDYVAEKYGLDMKEGRWDQHHQGLAFGPDGEILDGQHRLWGVMISGVTVKFLCTFNMPPDAQRSIDDHQKRTVRDVAAIMMGGRTSVENLHAAIANRMKFGNTHIQTKGRGISKQQTLGYMMTHFEPIDFAVHVTGSKKLSGITRAAVLAPVARAWFTQDKERLAEFVHVLMTGQTENGKKDYMAQQLRDYLLRSLSKKSRPHDEVIYSKVERALLAFLKGEQTLKLYEATTELFPIPSDESKKPVLAASEFKARRLAKAAAAQREETRDLITEEK
jgi:hypothetical protein